eukprot:TRINITY_DN1824_c0_g2_i2.p1 TRINITY_DN1824_c0_g2~~TRINITY_DN1824_c0_g2_i2.p1  ORF type:complete len:130 (+),score=22.99 TRINITY_DN1824_c0_g2_i2:49-438(+)
MELQTEAGEKSDQSVERKSVRRNKAEATKLPPLSPKVKRGRSIQHKKKLRPFVLDCCKFSQIFLPAYEGLADPLLGDFFRRPRMRHHLMHMKLVNRKGEIVAEKKPLGSAFHKRTSSLSHNDSPVLPIT